MWSRSDTFSAIAIAISLVALINSGFLTLIAHRKAKADEDATKPVADNPVIARLREWPEGWFKLTIRIKNRSDYTIETESLTIIKPSNITAISYDELIIPHGELTARLVVGPDAIPPEPPQIERLSRVARFRMTIRPDGTMYNRTGFPQSADVSNARFVLFVSSKRSLRRSKKLVMSLSLARTNRSVSNSSIPIITTTPETSASGAI